MGGRGQPGAFTRLGGVRRLAHGERRMRERNKISVEGGEWCRRMSSRAGRWKRVDEGGGSRRASSTRGNGRMRKPGEKERVPVKKNERGKEKEREREREERGEKERKGARQVRERKRIEPRQ